MHRFAASHLPHINSVVAAAIPKNEPLSTPAHYVLNTGGKRLRSLLTIAVAESLDVSLHKVDPLIQAVELLHAGSLVFDDLPAQDNATKRRGKPTVHLAFNEWTAQLTGLSLVTQAFGVLTKLHQYFSAEKVVEVEAYMSSIVGMEGLCKGQALDLQLTSDESVVTANKLLEMFHYKTSLLIEASLLPILILTDSNKKDIARIKKFAHHAGIVYQIRDDILDVTSTTSTLGKNAQHDSDRTNFARMLGLEQATLTLQEHLQSAKKCVSETAF